MVKGTPLEVKAVDRSIADDPEFKSCSHDCKLGLQLTAVFILDSSADYFHK